MNGVMNQRGTVLSASGKFDQLARILTARSEIDFNTLYRYRGPVSTFSILLQKMDTSPREWPIDERHDLAVSLAESADINSPDLFRLALDCNAISSYDLTYQIEGEGPTLLHAAASAFIELSGTIKSPLHNDFTDFRRCSLLGWKFIIQELLDAGADLHATCSQNASGLTLTQPCTPLMYSLKADDHWMFRWKVYKTLELNNGLQCWVSTLRDLGIDLIGYGQRETLLWSHGEVLDRDVPLYYDPYYFGHMCILGFTYGPCPEDWRLWENEPTDEFAGDFWQLVERKVEVMPGSWIE